VNNDREEESYIEVAYRDALHRLFHSVFETAFDSRTDFEQVYRFYKVRKDHLDELRKNLREKLKGEE